MKKLRSAWHSLFGGADRRVRLGRILGLLFVGAGFLVIGKAWDGAASINFAQGQIPYLLSGGFIGLGLIVFGSALLFLSTIRAEREILTERFDEMATLLGRGLSRMQFSPNGVGSTDGQVIAASGIYHRAGCRVLEGKDGLMVVTVEQAAAEGLDPCRVCDPPRPERKEEDVTAAS